MTPRHGQYLQRAPMKSVLATENGGSRRLGTDMKQTSRYQPLITLALTSSIVTTGSCFDYDGANPQPNGPDMGGATGSGMSGAAGGLSGAASDGTSGAPGSGGSSGSSGAAGAGGGSVDCTPVPVDAGADAGDADSGGGAIPSVVSFVADIHPIFAARCGPCHVLDNDGRHNVGAADVDSAYDDAVEHAEAILVRVNGGGMPPPYAEPPNNCESGNGPGDPGCVSENDFALIQAWIDQCYPR